MRKLPPRSTSHPVNGFYRARMVAKVLKCSQKTVHNSAARYNWPRRKRKNFFEFAVPMALAKKCAALVAKEDEPQQVELELKVNEASLTRRQRARLLFRLAGVAFYKYQITGPAAVANGIALARAIGFLAPVFRMSERTLGRLVAAYDDRGLVALVDQRAGRSGRRKTGVKSETGESALRYPNNNSATANPFTCNEP